MEAIAELILMAQQKNVLEVLVMEIYHHLHNLLNYTDERMSRVLSILVYFEVFIPVHDFYRSIHGMTRLLHFLFTFDIELMEVQNLEYEHGSYKGTSSTTGASLSHKYSVPCRHLDSSGSIQSTSGRDIAKTVCQKDGMDVDCGLDL
jgi:hypothetical protein